MLFEGLKAEKPKLQKNYTLACGAGEWEPIC